MKEEQKEEEEKIGLVPAEEPPPLILLERDAKRCMNELADLCSMFQAASNLPATSKAPRAGNFYVEEVIRTLREYNIIE